MLETPCTPVEPVSKWYVIQTKPKKEHEAKLYLSAKGVEIFSPTMEIVSTRGSRMVNEQHPLFPGYVFGRFNLLEDYSLVRWGRGVKKIVSFGAEPVPVADGVIEVIRQRAMGGECVRKACSFEKNDLVRVRSGPMKDLLGIFDRWVSETERVRILLNLVGYRPMVEMHYSLLEKVA
jgi:transcription elongation factor/antiterminator RfaH